MKSVHHRCSYANFLAIALVLLCVLALCPVHADAATSASSSTSASGSTASSYSGPDFQTTSTTNADGTITVRTSITGKKTTTTVSSAANLIILYDVTGSMGIPVPVTVKYASSYYSSSELANNDFYADDGNGFIKPVYHYSIVLGIISGFAFYDTNISVSSRATIYITPKGNTTTRMSIANDAAQQLGSTLLAAGMNTTITLVPFKLSPFNEDDFAAGQGTDFNNALSSAATAGLTTTAGGQGTNWSNAFAEAQSIMQQHPNTPQSIVLISDGEPNQGTVDMTELSNWINSNITNRSNFQKFYTVYTSSDATTAMSTLASRTGATLFNGTSDTDIQSALHNIASEVKVSTSYNRVSVSSTLGSNVQLPVQNGVSNPHFMYYTRTNGGADTAWTNAPTATVSNGTINWDLSSVGTLDPNTTYILQYTVVPTRQQLDTAAIAALNGGAAVTTPAISSSTLSYTAVTAVGEQVPTTVTTSYVQPIQSTTQVSYSTLNISASFTGSRPAPSSVTAKVLRDGADYTTATLSSSNNYTASIPVSINHTYTVVETQPSGFTVTNPAAITLTGSPAQTQNLSITNTAIDNKLRIHYVDTTNNGATAVPHGQFVVTNTSTHASLSLTVNAQGYATSTSPLADGTYTITQSIAPAGYAALDDTYTLTISGNTWTLRSGTRTLSVTQPEFGIKQITFDTQKIDQTLPNTGGPLLWLYGIGFVLIMTTTTVATNIIITRQNRQKTAYTRR